MRLSRRLWTKYFNGYFLSAMALLSGFAEAQIVHVWDLGDRARAGQFTIYNPDINDAEFGTPVAAGDLPGQVLDMADPPPGTTVIYRARAGAIVGDSMAAGDIHGDGYADLFVGVPGDEGPLQRSFSGGIAVIAGAPDLPGEIDLLDPQVPVVWVQAPDHFDFAAYWSASGDLDGDGFLDVIPNGMAGDGPNNRRDNAGEAHVISGRYLAQFLPGEPVTVVGERTAPIPAGLQLYSA